MASTGSVLAFAFVRDLDEEYYMKEATQTQECYN